MARLLIILTGVLFVVLLLAASVSVAALVFAFDQVRPIFCEGHLTESKLECIRAWQPLATALLGFLIGGAALLSLSLLVFENRDQRRILEQFAQENRIQREVMQEQFKVATWDVRRRVDNALAKITTGLTVRLSNLKQTYEVLGENYTKYGVRTYSDPVARSAKRLRDELEHLESELRDTRVYPMDDIANSKSNSEYSGLAVHLSTLKETLASFIEAYHAPKDREEEGEELFGEIQSRFADFEKSMDRLISQLKLNRSDFDIHA